MATAFRIIMAIPAGTKERRQSKAKRLLSMRARATIDKAPKALRQDRTTQRSTGTIRAKKPAVLQATAEVSTRAMPIAVFRSAAAGVVSKGRDAPIRFVFA